MNIDEVENNTDTCPQIKPPRKNPESNPTNNNAFALALSDRGTFLTAIVLNTVPKKLNTNPNNIPKIVQANTDLNNTIKIKHDA